MACSPEQLASNRKNSLKSTGPKSTTGKERVRSNALKHGLTGAGIALPDEDAAVIQERIEEFEADLKPTRITSVFVVRYLAMISVRMERCVRQETASLTKQMLLAEQTEADAHRDELQALVDGMSQEPEAAYRKLQRSPRGLAWMITQWEDLKADLAHPDRYRWNQSRIERAENLIGHRFSSPFLSRIGVLSHAHFGNFSSLKADDWPDLPNAEKQEAARTELGQIMDGEISRLKGVLESLDRVKLAEIESGAMTRALFDASKEAVLARKYAAAAERGFYKALKEFAQLEASAIADETPDANNVTIDQKATCDESALFFPVEAKALEGATRRPRLPADRRCPTPKRPRRPISEAPAKPRE